MKTKRTLSLLLACLMLLGICPLSVIAADSTEASTTEEAKTYADYYVQDNLVFFWNGEKENLSIHSSSKRVGALLNTLDNGYGDITSVTTKYDNNAPTLMQANSSSQPGPYFRLYDGKGVLFRSSNSGQEKIRLVLTDLIPTRLGETKALADMTLEVSQMHPNAKNNGESTTLQTNYRWQDGRGNMLLGPVQTTEEKMAYNSIWVNGELYCPFNYTYGDVNKTVYIKDFAAISAGKTFVCYEYDEANHKMKSSSVSVTVGGTDGNDAKLLAIVDANGISHTSAIYNGSNLFSKIGPCFRDYLPFAANGYGPFKSITFAGIQTAEGDTSLVSVTYNAQNFMNAKTDVAFTTSMIFDYDYTDTDDATSYGYTLTLGRDGQTLDGAVTGTYNAATDYNGNVTGNYSFLYGNSINARAYYSIRIYDRALTEEELAQNAFVDLAYQFDADLSDYDKASDAKKAELHALTKGKDASFFTAESFKKLIDDTLGSWSYDDFYVQDGLVFFWNGEGNTLGETVKKVTSLADTREGKDLAITDIANDRNDTGKSTSIANYSFSNTANKETGFLTVDKGVLVRGGKDVAMKLVLTDLIPTRTIGEAELLADMTLEVSQMHPNALNKSSASATPMLFQRNSNGDKWAFGPVSVSGTKGAYNSVNYNGTYYYAFTLKENSETVYIEEISDTSKGNIPYYTYNGTTMTKLGTFATQADAQAALSIEMPANTVVDPLATIGSSTNNSFLGLSPYDAAGHGPYQKFTVGSKTFDDYSGEAFMNAPVDTAFTTSVIFNYDYKDTDTATEYGYTLTLGRDGEALGQTVTGTYNQDSSKTFVYGTAFGARIYYSIRLYAIPLDEDQIAQNNFIDVAYQLDLDLAKYKEASDKTKKLVHALTVGKLANDFDAEDLQTKVDMILAGGEEAKEIAVSDVVTFNGYSIRLLGNPGLRAVFTVDRAFVNTAEENTAAKITEIGAIVAIKDEIKKTDGTIVKDEYTLDDLTVAGGTSMSVNAIYTADGGWAKDEETGEEKLFTKTQANGSVTTHFALATLFDSDIAQTAERYQTELLYRGYVIVTVGKENFVFYTDMTAPSFATLSMYEATNVYVDNYPNDAEAETVKKVLSVFAGTADEN